MTDPASQLIGIATVLNTPFGEDDRVDDRALAHHVEAAVEAGVAGFLYPAMASEVSSLTPEERHRATRTVLAAASGAVPVIVGASAESAAERRRNVEAAVKAGSDGVLVSLPWEGDAGRWASEVAALAELGAPFLMVQDYDPHGFGVPPEVVLAAFDSIQRFRSIKVEVVAAGIKYTRLLEATERRLHTAGGWAVSQLIEALDRGVHAFMPTAMHEIYVAIDRAHREGARERARAIFNRLTPVLAFSNQHLDVSILFFKRLLARQGIYPTARCRSPRLVLDRYHERIADELIDDVLQLIVELREGR